MNLLGLEWLGRFFVLGDFENNVAMMVYGFTVRYLKILALAAMWFLGSISINYAACMPDNRILSASVLKELMSYGAKHGKQIVVFNDRLLNYGALMSFSSNNADVADQVIRMLQDLPSGRKAFRPGMLPLTKMRVRLNSKVAHDLGLSATSPEFQRFLRSD